MSTYQCYNTHTKTLSLQHLLLPARIIGKQVYKQLFFTPFCYRSMLDGIPSQFPHLLSPPQYQYLMHMIIHMLLCKSLNLSCFSEKQKLASLFNPCLNFILPWCMLTHISFQTLSFILQVFCI